MNKIIRNTIILTVITVISGFLLGLVYEVTAEPIARTQEAAKKEAWQAVFPDASEDAFQQIDVDADVAAQVVKDLGVDATVDEVCAVDGGETGYVVTVTDGEGYGGDIQITVGITADGTVSGVSFLSISETAGLGMKAQEPSFYEQYVGVQAERFYVSKDGGEGEPVDAISGATITTRAVTGAVNTALGYFQNAFKEVVEMNSCGERLKNGLITENPIFVLMLGMCPTLAVTTSAVNGIGMGLSTTAVLVMSNLLISMLRKIIPDSVRMPAFIVVVASFVTIVDFLMEGFTPSLYSALGIYIPLIVVNCIILGRAESYASKNPVLPSIFDGLGMGLGFTVALIAIGLVREIIGAGQAFGYQLLPIADEAAGTAGYVPVAIFVQAPGAFLVLAVLAAIQNKVKINLEKKGKDASKIQSGCGADCATCGGCPSGAGNGKE